MSLYNDWHAMAYNKEGRAVKALWDIYLPLEQKIYEGILEQKITTISGTIDELGERYQMRKEFVCGFLDGINEAALAPLDMEALDENEPVSIDLDFEKLYKKMVELGADHLHQLPQWDNIFDEETRERFYKEQKTSRTFIREGAKVGRNDPCPCGSGKKYKKCCGIH